MGETLKAPKSDANVITLPYKATSKCYIFGSVLTTGYCYINFKGASMTFQNPTGSGELIAPFFAILNENDTISFIDSGYGKNLVKAAYMVSLK